MTAVITDIASYIPELRLDNEQNCERFGIKPAFLDEKIGTRRVARMGAEEDSATMAAQAVRVLLGKMNRPAGDIDSLVVCTQNPAGGGIPHTSARVHHALSLRDDAACFDLSLGCSGYVYGLSVLAGFLEANDLRGGVLVTSDPYSPILDENDKNTTLLFGDAATATWLSRDENAQGWRLGRCLFGTRGSSGSAISNDAGTFQMNGRQVFEFCVREVPAHIRRLLDAEGLSLADLDALALHQGSRFIVDQIGRALDLPPEKVPVGLSEVGNTVSSSIPLLLERDIFPRQCRRVLLSGFGVGLSWASALLERTH